MSESTTTTMDLAGEYGSAAAVDVRARGEVVRVLYQRYHLLVYRLALRYGNGNAAWAEDVTQDVFMRLIDVVERLRDHDTLHAWFYRVTTHRCLNRLRRDRLGELAPIRWMMGREPEVPDPERVSVAREALDLTWEAVQRLPPLQRVAFCMYHLDGMQQVEIARTLGHSKGYVSKLISRAEHALRTAGWEVAE